MVGKNLPKGMDCVSSLVAGAIIMFAFLVAIAIAGIWFPLSLPMALFVIIALAMLIPESYDIYLAYQNKDKDGKPTGIDGLGRTIMAYSIILVLGAATFLIITLANRNLETLPTNFSSLDPKLISLNVTSNTTSLGEIDKMIDIISKNNEAVIDSTKTLMDATKSVLTTLGGAVSAIIGFYFGQRATESREGKKSEQPGGPILNAVTPPEGKIGDEVTLTGTNLGSSQNGSVILFGSKIQLKSKEWSETSIKVEVPEGLTPGETAISVVVNGVSSNKILFTVKQ